MNEENTSMVPTTPTKKPMQWKKGTTITAAALIIVIGVGAALAIKYSDRITTFVGITAVPPTGQGAFLKLTPASATVAQNGTFTEDIILDAGTNNILSAGAYLTFDTTKLKVNSVDTSTSAFSLFVEDGTTIPRFDNTAGTVSLSAGSPSGVTGNNLKIATVTFQAKTTAGATAITFNYGGTRNSGTSQAVIIDAGSAVDVLDGITPANITVQSPLPAAPTVTIDATYAKYSTKLRATWTLSDATVTSYEYRVLDSAGTQIYPATAGTYTNIGNVTSVITSGSGVAPGLNLVNGKSYKIAVRAVNATGNGPEGISGLVTTASANLDHTVPEVIGTTDLAQLALGWGLTTKPNADINQDGKVDVKDLALLAVVYGTTL